MADIMSKEKRSALMSLIKGKNTKPELLIFRDLRRRGFYPRKHYRGLPGCPDVVFVRARVAVFIDGDFWHGWKFPLWQDKLPPFWREKIMANRKRDQKNFRKLRKAGWKVIRIWEHQVYSDLDSSIEKIIAPVQEWRSTQTRRSDSAK